MRKKNVKNVIKCHSSLLIFKEHNKTHGIKFHRIRQSVPYYTNKIVE